MPRLKNRYSVPSVPIFWKEDTTGHRVEWRTATETFQNWVGKVFAFCDGNNLPRPSEDLLDEVACSQMPKSYCSGEPNRNSQVMVARSGGCSACGGRHS